MCLAASILRRNGFQPPQSRLGYLKMSPKNTNSAAIKLNDLEMANRLLDSIASISKVITAPKLKFQGKINKVLEVILDYLSVEHGSIMLLEKNSLVVKTASRKDLIGIKQPISDNSVAGWVATNCRPLFVSDITQDKRFARRGGANYKKKALLSAPIISNNKAVGVINVTDKTGSADLLQDDISYLLEFSSLLVWLIIQEDLNETLKKKKNTLNKRNKELRRQEKLRSDLTRSLVHDLKGPLSEVVANLDILSYSISDDNKEFLESAQIGCDRAVRMVSNLVSVDKLEDGKIQLLNEKIDPASLLEESVSGVKGLAKIKNVSLKLDFAGNLPQVTMDRILILRVLQNLLTNALEYAPAGSIITTGCELIEDGQKVKFFVQDCGEGIPPEQQSTIFEKYARISEEHDHLIGTGLGLFFCKLTVVEHRGEIGVKSTPPNGSCFYFTLPVN